MLHSIRGVLSNSVMHYARHNTDSLANLQLNVLLVKDGLGSMAMVNWGCSVTVQVKGDTCISALTNNDL
jgi:hypothetical protein